MKPVHTLVFAVAMMGACSYGAPDIPVSAVVEKPTYDQNIRPLLVDHCLVCHSAPPRRGAPGYFRLDVYDPSALDPKSTVLGAKQMAGLVMEDARTQRMPPTAKDGEGVGPNGIRLLENWVANDAP